MSAVTASARPLLPAERQRKSLSVPDRLDQVAIPALGSDVDPQIAKTADKDRHGDEQLVREAQAGCAHAFELLVWKHQARVLNVAKGYVGESDAPDVAQEAFLKCYRALPSFRGESAFYTWLHTITVNSCRNHLVARRRRPAGQDVDAVEAEHSGFADKLSDHQTPERAALADEVGIKITKALNGLPQDLREALLMRERDGLTYEEIAEAAGCPVGTVRSRLFRAREAIDRVVEPLMAA